MHIMQTTAADFNSDDDRCENRFDENDAPVILVLEGILLLFVVIV